jgi:hypothetical protein
LPNFSTLKNALVQATNEETSGLNMNMWATIVDRDGIVCAVALPCDLGTKGKHRLAAVSRSTRVAYLVGAVGVSGDTSCADHFIAWRLRRNLNLDHLGNVIGGLSGDADRPDNISFDIIPNPNGGTGISAGGFGHPTCINTATPANLPKVRG